MAALMDHALPMPGPAPFDDPEATDKGLAFFDIPGKREILTVEELLFGLTNLMRTCEGCENVSVLKVDRLDPPDSRDGCNWGLTLVLDAAGVPPEVYALAYASVIRTARESWNLAEPQS